MTSILLCVTLAAHGFTGKWLLNFRIDIQNLCVLFICAVNGSFLNRPENILQWAITRGLVTIRPDFSAVQCGGIRETYEPDPSPFQAEPTGSVDQTPAQKYAAELLSYMMQVVVGAAGDPAKRQAWKTRSLSVTLDYQRDSRYHERSLKDRCPNSWCMMPTSWGFPRCSITTTSG